MSKKKQLLIRSSIFEAGVMGYEARQRADILADNYSDSPIHRVKRSEWTDKEGFKVYKVEVFKLTEK